MSEPGQKLQGLENEPIHIHKRKSNSNWKRGKILCMDGYVDLRLYKSTSLELKSSCPKCAAIFCAEQESRVFLLKQKLKNHLGRENET